ncbi:MAG TPA: nitrous oxide-stimulated promoter family protein [Anaerolineae bacterium]|nr:nitrous oxide-stimulated promoter family protein [Anaerolineae bacterium]
MTEAHPRIERERRTVEAMIALYCHGEHGTQGELCDECSALDVYARQRLEKCPFREAKTTCAKCPIHCYRPEMRERVRAVMRYAGPRMIYRHPVLAILHLLDGRRATPGHDLAASISRRRRSQHTGG